MQARIALLALSLAVGTVSSASGESSHMLMISCNSDGTYTCGFSCEDEPYNGRWCCRSAE